MSRTPLNALPLQEKDQTVDRSPPRKKLRRRIRKACEPCRHRKVKCDGGHPCEICIGYDYSCVYANTEIPTSSSEQVISGGRLSIDPDPASQARNQPFQTSETHETTSTEPQKQLYELSEERQSSRTGNTRFTRVDSAIAFPRSLGLALNADEPPRLHAFAWNTGTRIDNNPVIRQNILQYLAPQDVKSLSNVFFTSVNPMFDIISHDGFNHRASSCWETQDIDAGFEVVLCGVLALGSLFSAQPAFIREAEIVEQARLILDSTFAHSEVLLSVDFVVGWLLRAIYLRCTTKPHVSWVASSMAMHIAESIGLHQEMSEIRITPGKRVLMSEEEIKSRRRVFWTADCLNRLFSAQYGRTKITLQNITCRYPMTVTDDGGDDFISLIRLMPDLCDIGSPSSATVLTDGILRLGNMAISKPPLMLMRADAMFCIYRKLRYIGVTLSQKQTEVILSMIRSALEAADSLVTQSQQWWTIIGVPFHSICVLIALNTMESLTLLQKAMETLQNVVTIFNSHVSREALRTAHYLVKVTEKKRRGELECLQRCLNLNAQINVATPTQTPQSDRAVEIPSFEWPTDIDLGFFDFLNTNYMDGGTGMAGGIDGLHSS
ncbi:Protein RDR1 [Lachnellula hyalina]|uniref:Protein RDR1 n=1 Tax=Lachnellula hyalina TaxID=1316788 RepID=A0A8H8QTT1_9HELO|nr:Protein RDR1 [Lachnellula hyalina]TVY22652.1 Protein RDR1 [Lachnellula hyalina]